MQSLLSFKALKTNEQESLRNDTAFDAVQDDQESLGPWMKYEEENEREIICPHCGDTSFPNHFTLKAHLKTCKPPTVEASKTCPKCHKKFSSTKYLIYRHIKNCPGDDRSTIDEVSGFEIPSFKCDKCSKEYRTFCHFIHHVSVCGKSSTGDKRDSVLWKAKNICNKCGKLFNSLEEKREANHFCNPEKHFKCPKCDYQSYYIRRVKDHYEIKHGCERRFCCHTCGKTFAYKTALNTHLKIHAERKHVCSECGKKFVHKTTLDLHLTTHFRKEMPCDKCGKIFPNSTYLNRHIHSHTQQMEFFISFNVPTVLELLGRRSILRNMYE
ncbi:KRAB [Lepeophtheirus salmonis]|uniref:KRAB n=1 Tax=Lepeophtheirus salmonis TaxID=72036 RepID=A0A7R8H2Z3_LEPSM|nr:KRAB [Lepeophtheirus salmonis]CAF2837944.1 KRAB [Lepeophtheirus salmonis]